MAEQQGAARVLRRRGILAAAGAVVAGIAAKQTAQPALAAYNLQGDASNTATLPTSLIGAVSITSGVLYVENTTLAFGGHAINAKSPDTALVVSGGIVGMNVGGSSMGILAGATAGHGVVGQTTGPDGQGYVGVYGKGKGSGTAG